MARFYRAMLVDHLKPAAALRSAQLSIRAERRWRDPYYWAPFVLQGDWE
jgi:CHAT domain-containing protein